MYYFKHGQKPGEKMLSIKAAHEEKTRLEQEAVAVWEKLAEDLAALIPSSLHKFAVEKGWVKNDVDNWWTLPKFFENLVNNTRNGGFNSEDFGQEDLQRYGFENFDALKVELHGLEQAWNNLVRLETSDREFGVRVYYSATEITPERTL